MLVPTVRTTAVAGLVLLVSEGRQAEGVHSFFASLVSLLLAEKPPISTVTHSRVLAAGGQQHEVEASLFHSRTLFRMVNVVHVTARNVIDSSWRVRGWR